ncbi:MAG: FAD-dependent oxidoreductase [Euryarchaeota archaeon]|nr:FAD-dependent oxidoreductase [Euryarchaeota archaeon]
MSDKKVGAVLVVGGGIDEQNRNEKPANARRDAANNESKIGAVLVVGGGIGGMQSALDLANSGFKVYLLEEKPAIGGVMAQLDKTFPTNDCSMCIMSPKLVEVGRHPNIELITYADLEEVSGEAGNFHVKVRRKAGFVDMEKCTGCGECANSCTVELPNEFDEEFGTRKAIYIPYPQAIPHIYTIDKHGLQPCKDACPAGVGAPGYMSLVARGKFYQALRIIKERLPFPSICGRVCHRPCENVCTRKEIDDPVQIAHIKRFVGDLELKVPFTETPPIMGRPENIAIVGRGPAGLTAAHDLALMGYHVTIFESAPVLGGMMKFGIPIFRLPKEILRREISDILALGIKVYLNTPIGKNVPISDLFNRGYKAVFLAVGAQKGKTMGIPGEELEGVFQAIDFLKEVNLGELITTPITTIDENLCIGCGTCAPSCLYGAIKLTADEKNPRKRHPKVIKYLCKGCGKCASICPSEAIKLSGFHDVVPDVGDKVVVVGGGNAALDTARSALRLGAKEVSILYRRSRDEMPAEPDWEIDMTESEGVKLVYLTAPTRVIGESGHVTAIECVKMELLEECDKSGRRKIRPVPGSEFTMDIDSIILAIGQEVDAKCLTKDDGLECTPWNTIKADSLTFATNIDGVFCGGDAIKGAGTVIEAIAAGKEVAISIDRYINGRDLKEGREIKPKIAHIPLEGIKRKPRVHMRYVPVEERKNNFNEVELGYSEEEAIAEARRCLNCGGCVECLECVTTCKAGAIVHNMTDKTIELDVGSIILAPGYEKFDARIKGEYGYGRYKNVLTSLEFERILSASGPYQGHVVRPYDKKEPKKIAWLQCVGSRDQTCGNNYCSSVCCTYAIKEAVIAKEHVSTIEPTIFYMDMRTYGKGFEAYYNRAKDEYGVKFVRCRISDVQEEAETKNLRVTYETEDGKLKEEEFDMVVLSVGFEPSDGVRELAEKVSIKLNEYGFCETSELSPTDTTRQGVYVCGAFSGPKDIPETVMEASGAAAKAGGSIASERNSLVEKKEYPPEIDVKGQEPRIGVFVCNCGINIGAYVDVPSVVDYAKALLNVVLAEENLYTCSQDTQDKIVEKIKEHQLNRVIVASCTPRTHEPLFQETIREAGLNPHLFEMANIRDQCSWVHMKEPEKATEKAKDLVRMAAAKARLLEPLPTISLDIIQKGLVIGGGLAGMISALAIAEQGYEAYLIEKENVLGGNLRNIHYTLENEALQEYLESIIEKVKNSPLIKIYKNARIEKIEGYVGNYLTTVNDGAVQTALEHGAIIVATGAEESRPTEYLYGKDERVITQLELEKQLAESKILNKKTIVMIQCVGSRDEEHPYCSRVCCSDAIKNALRLKEKCPSTEIFILYRDMRTYGFKESYYEKAREKGITFVRYDVESKPKVQNDDGKLEVLVRDPILQEELLIDADLVVLSPAVVPRKENSDLAKQLKVPLNADGFFLEAHVKLRPVDFATEGIFLAGMAHSPKSIGESISQAYAAASRACALISHDVLQKDPIISSVVDKNCDGCAYCVDPCPFNAITLIEYMRDGQVKKTIELNEAICKGCGVCMATCPKLGVYTKGFTYEQIMAQAKAAMQTSVEAPPDAEFEPRIVAFCCNWCSYAGADLAGVSRYQYPPNVRIVRVMCSGMVHPNFVIETLMGGADGVLICGCHPGDCHYLEGNLTAEKRAEAIKLMLEDLGLEAERFKLAWVSASEGQRFAEIMRSMVEQVKALGPNQYGG